MEKPREKHRPNPYHPDTFLYQMWELSIALRTLAHELGNAAGVFTCMDALESKCSRLLRKR